MAYAIDKGKMQAYPKKRMEKKMAKQIKAQEILAEAAADYQSGLAMEAAQMDYQADMRREAAQLEEKAAAERQAREAAAIKILPQNKSGRGKMGSRFLANGKSENGFLLSAGSGQIDKAYMEYRRGKGRFPSMAEAAAMLAPLGLSEKDILIHIRFYQRHRGLYI